MEFHAESIWNSMWNLYGIPCASYMEFHVESMRSFMWNPCRIPYGILCGIYAKFHVESMWKFIWNSMWNSMSIFWKLLENFIQWPGNILSPILSQNFSQLNRKLNNSPPVISVRYFWHSTTNSLQITWKLENIRQKDSTAPIRLKKPPHFTPKSGWIDPRIHVEFQAGIPTNSIENPDYSIWNSSGIPAAYFQQGRESINSSPCFSNFRFFLLPVLSVVEVLLEVLSLLFQRINIFREDRRNIILIIQAALNDYRHLRDCFQVGSK